MKCLIRFMRKGCERRRRRTIGIAGEGNDLGAMVDAKESEKLYWDASYLNC